MALPFFYMEQIGNTSLVLDEDTSKHVVQVLRMQAGEELLLTDGKGGKARAVIRDDNRKRCAVEVLEREKAPEPATRIAIAISLVKNAARFEWFLEKATEIGVSEIIPLLCERTEKEKFRFDRMKGICISAMLQSQQSRMPVLHEPTAFSKVVTGAFYEGKFIAHCLEEEKRSLVNELGKVASGNLLLIGPEGDFTPAEIRLALENNYLPVSLGQTRLRTETAGLAGAVLLCIRS